MQTTQLYVEIIIIGLEGSIGLSFAFMCVFGREQFVKFLSFINSAPMVVILIGFLYILGLIIDRFADMIFQGWEDKFRKLSGLQTKSVLLLLTKENQTEFLEITRNKNRILRASIITSTFAITMSSFFIITQPFNNKIGILLFSILLGLFFVFTSIFSYRKMLKKYYNRARIIELDYVKKK